MTWARRKFGGGMLHGTWLRQTFTQPEDGVFYDEGNGVVRGGMLNLALVLTGTGGYQMSPGRAVFGVGSDATEFDREHVHLSRTDGEDPGRSWYRPLDKGFPTVTSGAVIKVQATFTEMEACFDWHEWCLATGATEPGPHHSLREAYGDGSAVMMNRKAHPAGYGVKETGVAWVFRTEILLT